MQKPKALRPGCTVGLVGPSGAIRIENGLERGIAALEAEGYRVVVGESAGARYGYLSGSDELRARDLNAMFADDSVDAIICTKGGYGTPRILDRLDFDIARRHPKILLGYSDITCLHLAYGKFSQLITFQGPMPCTMREEEPDGYNLTMLRRALTSTQPLGTLANGPEQEAECVIPGRVSGELTGGNLSLVVETLGTPYEIDCRGKLLFLEDIGEAVYRLDNMLTHLRLAGKFRDCCGIVLGDFTNCVNEYEDYALALPQVISDILPHDKPILANFSAGHGKYNMTLPFGIRYALDSEKRTLTALESALT